MHFKRKPKPSRAFELLARMEEIAPTERGFILYPALRIEALGLTYCPAAPHFEEDSPTFPNWQRSKGSPWERI